MVDQLQEGIPASFFTSCGILSAESAANITQKLSNQACLHHLSPAMSHGHAGGSNDLNVDSFALGDSSRYGSKEFYGVVIDTGAAKRSTAGIHQFQALQRLTTATLDESSKGKVTVQFGIGTTSSLGSSVVQTPIGDVEFHIMPARTPFLLSLDDMDALGVYFNNLTNTLITP